ncbi:hypothetical protein PSTG_10317 [Puccinia striiformis f. sp. tritici PST-78]|uniref:Uncharacterized protein n=1 Tax=Puccinia striiformis f. sp. tritici PST-78 TaxID=1165861 RepID=A0A0L0VAW7_9BASI|nr:hypothetical protein PSTG_10317 [Puccinia striiformis f. sp. tritici PST-78]
MDNESRPLSKQLVKVIYRRLSSLISMSVSPRFLFILIRMHRLDSVGFKGERMNYLIELMETKTLNANPGNSTYEFDRLTPFIYSTIQAGGSFFINHVFDIKAIEVARAWRLTGNQDQVVSIEIPRSLVELVQDDVFSRLGSLWIPSSKTVKGG